MASRGDQTAAGALPDRLQRSEMSGETTPIPGSRKRGRHASACSQCHVRKQKCNGDRPCLNCMQRGVANLCSGPPVQSRGSLPRKRKPSSGLGQPTSAVSQAIPRNSPTLGSGQPGPPSSQPPPSQPRIGQLWRSRGAPAFYGTSYFGPQVAASMINSPAPDIPVGTGSARKSINARPFRDESGPFSQIWDLLGLLPRQKSTVDHLIDRFFEHVNGDIDAVHQASFNNSYVQFWERKSGFDDVTTVDLRWLALLFVILAIGAYLDCPHSAPTDTQRDYEEASLRFYWASRRAIVIAPSFYGESTDLVRAGILITRYLVQTQRLAESWLTVGFAARLGIAQGLHVDGEKWGLPKRSTETRRRLWCHLYALDRMISLALGRPYLISDAQSLPEEPRNVYVDDLTDEEAHSAQPLPLSNPTISVMASLEYQLAKVIGQIQEACFHFHKAAYKDVLALDAQLVGWKNALPPYFALQNPDLSLDTTHPFLRWQRIYLHTSFHFARITLHRPYLLRHSMTDHYQFSREACLSSARADLKIRLEHHCSDSAEHYTWSLAAHQLFNSAIVLGILAVREAKSFQTPGAIDDLEAYCELQRSEMWLSEFGLAEIKVVELCIAKLKQQVRGVRERDMDPRQQSPGTGVQDLDTRDSVSPVLEETTSDRQRDSSPTTGLMSPAALDGVGTSNWLDPMFGGSFPGFADLQTWQQMLDSIGGEFSA